MLTVGRLAKRFGLSRSTLLYYDSIGLLRPSERSGGDYRLYSDGDVKRLSQIMAYRSAGLALADIRALLDGPAGAPAEALEKRLRDIHEEMRELRGQQDMILKILRKPELLRKHRTMNRRTWTELLLSAGFTAADMRRWHVEFERSAPEEHARFLRLLRFTTKEADIIRSWASKTLPAREQDS